MIRHLEPKTLKHNYTRGVTLIELLVVVAIIAIITVITFLSLAGRKSRRILDTTTSQLVLTLREAESRAVAGSQHTAWGVHLDNTSTTSAFYALFASSSYAAQYEVSHYPLPLGVSYVTSTIPEGTFQDIVFSQLRGITTSTTVGVGMTSGIIVTSTMIMISGSGLVSF